VHPKGEWEDQEKQRKRRSHSRRRVATRSKRTQRKKNAKAVRSRNGVRGEKERGTFKPVSDTPHFPKNHHTDTKAKKRERLEQPTPSDSRAGANK
jgi:hypothetical protein